MPQTFRPHFKFWLIEALPFSLIVGAVFAAPYIFGGTFLFVPAACLLLFYFLVILRPALRTHIVADPQGISGRVGYKSFAIRWSDIIVADLRAGGSWQPRLVLGTAQGIAQISLLGFAVPPLWRIVQERVDAAALEDTAYRQLPGYRELADQDPRWVETAKPLLIRERIASFIGWLGVAFFTCMAMISWVDSSLWPRWVSLAIAVVGYFVILLFGTVEVDALAVTHTDPIVSIRMPWAEVERVFLAAGAGQLEIRGNKKAVILFGPFLWSNKELYGAISMIKFICQQRGIDYQAGR